MDEGHSSKGYVRSEANDKEWERKQRNREYRIAARREKRNRKADEKKQRKLNATILRRMTRNPDKYNKNAERNRLRDVEMERRKIRHEAVKQAQRLASIHDPSGAMFNVNPVVTTEDGTVITAEALQRRRDRAAGRVGEEPGKAASIPGKENEAGLSRSSQTAIAGSSIASTSLHNNINPERLAHFQGMAHLQHRSKTALKKLAKYEPKPSPPKPVLPEHIPLLEGEENWLALWDLDDNELERRVIRAKKRKAAERKALRLAQQSGKAERRMARDEKRRVYRDYKQEWRDIKAETTREKTRLRALEDEESKKVAVHVTNFERQRALDYCSSLGFTLENTEGVKDVKPKVLGMRGANVDLEALGKEDWLSGPQTKLPSKRVDLSGASHNPSTEFIPISKPVEEEVPKDFIKLDVGVGQDYEILNYNHKLRRKLRRAMEHADVEKELLVRRRALDYLADKGREVPEILHTATKPINHKDSRILDTGTLETAKQERVRARVDLTEFNNRMRVLRRQAKEAALYAGLYKHAEVTGTLPPWAVANTQPTKHDSGKVNEDNVLQDSTGGTLTSTKHSSMSDEGSKSSVESDSDESGSRGSFISAVEGSTSNDEEY